MLPVELLSELSEHVAYYVEFLVLVPINPVSDTLSIILIIQQKQVF